MQAKRSRLDSFAESDSTNGRALKKIAKMPAEALKSEQTPQPAGIFTVSSPEVTEETFFRRHVDINGELANFLEKCHFCRKTMLNADAFMYGDLRGFCSPECRSKHIAVEKLVKGIIRVQKERSSANENSNRSSNNNNNDMKNGSGFAQPNPSV